MNTQSPQTAVRVVLGDKTRRIRLSESTITCLAKSAADRFSVPASLTFGYVDDEEDFIQLSSDQELVFALAQFQRKLKIIASQTVEASIVPQPAIPVATPVVSPAKVVIPPETPAAVASVPAEQPAKPAAKPKKAKSSSLKPKSLRLTSQFYLVKSGEDKVEKRRLLVTPGSTFTKVWKFRNESTEAWPEDTQLTFVQGNQEALEVPTSTRVTPVPPSEEAEVSVSGKAPEHPGKFGCTFRFYSNGKLCGRKLKIVVVVKEPQADNKENTPVVVIQREKAPGNEATKGTPAKQRVKREKKPRKERILNNAN